MRTKAYIGGPPKSKAQKTFHEEAMAARTKNDLTKLPGGDKFPQTFFSLRCHDHDVSRTNHGFELSTQNGISRRSPEV